MRNLPTITKSLLLINLIVWLIDSSLQRRGIYISNLFGLWSLNTGMFRFWQPLTYMFLHADFGHIFCNMFAVWMFGPSLEESWGKNKYLLYYLICGLGAAATQLLVWQLAGTGGPAITIGASGAVFGILFAFGWLFPDVPMFILFIPVPIRARTFVYIYAAIELTAGFANVSFDNVAHFAHLGGMIFGWLLILLWRHPWNKFPRIKREDDEKIGKNFSDYHYQEPIR